MASYLLHKNNGTTYDETTIVVSTGGILGFDASGNPIIDTSAIYQDTVNHRLGVGTQSPLSTLDVTGDFRISKVSDPTSFLQTSLIGTVWNLKVGTTTVSQYTSSYYYFGVPLEVSQVREYSNNITLKLGGTYVYNGTATQQVSTDLYANISQSGTAGFTAVRLSPYISSVGSGTNLLLDIGTNSAADGAGTHSSLFNIDRLGRISVYGAPSTTAAMQVGATSGNANPGQLAFGQYANAGTGRPIFVGNWASSGWWGIGAFSISADNTLRIGRINGIGSDFTNNATNLVITGQVSLKSALPTAGIDLPAGTITAGTAPLKFTSGPLLTAPEVGTIEFLTDAFYATITTSAARKTMAFVENTIPMVTPGASGNVLTSNGSSWTSQTPSSGGSSNLGLLPTLLPNFGWF